MFKTVTRLAPLVLLFTTACDDVHDHDHDHDHNHGITTTLMLLFTPADGGETLTFAWSDPENDGNPLVDDIVLPDGSDHDHHDARSYTLELQLWNDLEDPAEDVTSEVSEDAASHQVFFTGSAVQSPATGDNPSAVVGQAYADTDANGLPIGLESTIDTLAHGTGELTVTLRHMPPENDEAVKTEGLAEQVATDGFSSIGGDNDIQVTFNLEVE